MGNQIPQSQQPCGHPFNYNQKCEDWTIDSEGLEQSPIDIRNNNAQYSNDTMKMEFFLADNTLPGLKVIDDGKSLTCFGPFSKLRAADMDGNTYEFEAIQFHFHAPAEHTINGGQYELELHIVHQMTEESAKKANTTRYLAVVGVFFELTKDFNATPNAFIDALNLPNVGAEFNLNMNDLLGRELKNMMTFYAYKGSLTTPPCSQTVNWYLFERPLKITQTQLNQFNLRWKDNINFACGHGNNRPTQPLYQRAVKKSNNCHVSCKSKETVKSSLLERRAQTTLPPEFKREIMFEDLSLRSSVHRGDTQGFIGTPTYTKRPSLNEKDNGSPSNNKRLSTFHDSPRKKTTFSNAVQEAL